MTKETLLYKLTGTETPRNLTKREQQIVDTCLQLITDAEQLHKPDVSNSKAAIPEINDGQLFLCNGVKYMIQSVKQATDRGNLENGHNIFTFY